MKKVSRTHTIKWNGDKTHRIITFTPRFMGKLKTAKHDMVIRVVLNKMFVDLKNLTGRKHTIAYEQEIELEEYAKSITNMHRNNFVYRIETWMVESILKSTIMGNDELFDLLNVIFPTLYRLESEFHH